MEEKKENNEKQEEAAEQKPAEETTPKGETTPDTNKPTAIERVEAGIENLEEIEKRVQKLVERQEAVASRMLLGGKGEGGKPIKTPEEEEKAKIDDEVAETLKAYD